MVLVAEVLMMKGLDEGTQVVRRSPVSLAKKSNRYRDARLEIVFGTTYRFPEAPEPDGIPFVDGVE
jgi:hypothetical protein